jgi:hypothetical protein
MALQTFCQPINRLRQGDYIYAFWLTALILFSGVAAGAAEPRPITDSQITVF